jgi:hypothetical protein
VKEEGFRRFLAEGKAVPKGLTEKAIRGNIRSVRDFESYLRKKHGKALEDATGEDLVQYSEMLVAKNLNHFEEYLGIIRYARFSRNQDVEMAIMILMDGAEVLGELSKIVLNEMGRKKHDLVFRGVRIPAMGSRPDKWYLTTKRLMEQFEQNVGQKGSEDLLLMGPHAGPPEAYADEKAMYEESRDIDDFLKKRHNQSLKTLERHEREGTLFFNQEIDDKVLEFVRGNQEVMAGVRHGDVIYETKIPHMAKEYLREKNARMKRYYFCHCPWVKHAIRDRVEVSPTFCYCSAGFHKKPWDVIFGRPVRAEVLSSVLAGDLVCRFAIHIPDEALPKKAKKARRKTASKTKARPKA